MIAWGFIKGGWGANPNVGRTLTPLKQYEVLYVQVDGSMVLTCEDGWTEVKVDLFFKRNDCCMQAQSKAG